MSDDQMRKLMDLLDKREDLHPDLVPYRRDDGPVGPMIHHPLVINMFHTDQENARINAAYLAKKQAVDDAMREKKWQSYIWMHERPYRFDAMMEAIEAGGFDDPETFWETVRAVWSDSENIVENYHDWMQVWDSDIPHREFAMDKEERAELAAMPDEITVYRGVGHKDAQDGMSWTTDLDKARWFAQRFAGHNGRQPHVVEGVIAKSQVLAYLTGRGESEIVAFPEDVRDQRFI